MQAARPLRGIGLHGDIERRLVADRVSDVPRNVLAVVGDPAPQEPLGNIKRLRLDLLDQRLSLAGATAQHRIDEPGIFRGPPIRLYQPHRQIDRGMIGHIHPENLRGADQERALRARRIRGDAAIEQPRQHVAERAEPPQDRRHQPPHQGAVAIGERLQSAMRAGALELLVQRPMLMQHAVEDIGCDPPRREPGHLGWQGVSLRRHGAGTSRKVRQRLAFDAHAIERKKHLCHAIMPNVRIALAISRSPYHVYEEALNCAAQSRGWNLQ